MIIRSATHRASVGARFLDHPVQDWIQRVKKPVDQGMEFECVLGQLFGSYRSGLERLHLTDDQALTMGFRACPIEHTWNIEALLRYLHELADAWHEEKIRRIV